MGSQVFETTKLLSVQSHLCHQETAKGELHTTGSLEASPPPSAAKGGGRGQALRHWCLWFLAFFGIYASSSVCPFCGTPGCPVGAGGATVVGGLGAFLWRFGGDIVKKVKEVAVRVSR